MTQIKTPEATPLHDTPSVKKIVPGAPPPTEKPSKKKRKTKTKTEQELKEETSKPDAAEEHLSEVPASASAEINVSEDDKKSQVIELLNKRIRNFSKKIVR